MAVKKNIIFILFLVLLLVISSCKESADTSEINYDSPDATPEEQGMDSRVLASAYDSFKNYSGVYSLIVMRNGKIVAEQYYNGKTKNDYTNIASVSKSFISALTGIALKEKLIDSLHQKVSDFFPAYFIGEADVSKKEITIENLLTMTSGLKSIHDVSSDWVSIPNIVSYAIGLPMLGYPGTRFDYNTALTHMLSVIISNKSGMSTFDYAKAKLFDKIGIVCSKWDKDLFGNYLGGTGMYFTPRELVKFGYLYMNEGKWDGLEIVPSSWVKESTQPYIKVEANYYYGYNWWILNSAGSNIFFAEGYGGQYIFVFKDYGLVVVATSNLNADENDNVITREFFPSKILPAIKK